MSDQNIPLSKQLNIPPVWLIGTLLVMWFWHAFLPIVKFGGAWSKSLGALVIVAAMALALSKTSSSRARNTTSKTTSVMNGAAMPARPGVGFRSG